MQTLNDMSNRVDQKRSFNKSSIDLSESQLKARAVGDDARFMVNVLYRPPETQARSSGVQQRAPPQMQHQQQSMPPHMMQQQAPYGMMPQ